MDDSKQVSELGYNPNLEEAESQNLENVESTGDVKERDSPFKVQIVVAPVEGCDGSAEIRIMGGTARRERNSRRNSIQPENSCSLHSSSNCIPLNANKMISEEQVSEFLCNHPEYLEKFVMDEVDVEQLERWIIRKSQRLKKRPDVASRNSRKTSLSRWKFCVHADKRQMLQDLTNSLQLKPTRNHVLWELSNCISSAVSADGFRLYTIEKPSSREEIQLFIVLDLHTESGELKLQKIKNGIDVPLYVAKGQDPVRISRGQNDQRFPADILEEVLKTSGLLFGKRCLLLGLSAQFVTQDFMDLLGKSQYD